MQNNDVAFTGSIAASDLKRLRKTFLRIFRELNDSDQKKMYEELYFACEVFVGDNGDELDVEKTEANLLELIHFLHGKDVRIPTIRGYIRCFSEKTKSLSRRFHVKDARWRKMRQSSELHFVAPVLEGASV